MERVVFLAIYPSAADERTDREVAMQARAHLQAAHAFHYCIVDAYENIGILARGLWTGFQEAIHAALEGTREG